MSFEKSSATQLREVIVDSSHLNGVVVLTGVVAAIEGAEPNFAGPVGYCLSPQLALDLAEELIEAVRELYDAKSNGRQTH